MADEARCAAVWLIAGTAQLQAQAALLLPLPLPRRRNYRAYTTMDPAAGYEVFALVPGLTADEVRWDRRAAMHGGWGALPVRWQRLLWHLGLHLKQSNNTQSFHPATLLLLLQVSVRCWSSGVVLIEGEPATSPTGPGASPPLSEHVQLPTRIDTRSAVAQVGGGNSSSAVEANGSVDMVR